MKPDNTKWWGIGLSTIYVIVCAYLLIFRLNDVWSNLEASFVWATPTAVSHIVLHKKIKQLNNKENISDN